MTVECYRQPLKLLEHLRYKEQKTEGVYQGLLFESWHKNKGFESPDLFHMSDHLLLLGTPKLNELPNMISMGNNSLASYTLGAGWRDDAIKKGEAEFLAPAYTDLMESREPVYEWVRYHTDLDGIETEMIYERALFLFKTKAGGHYIATMAKLLKFYQKDETAPSTNPNSRPLSFPAAHNPPLLGKDGSPIGTR